MTRNIQQNRFEEQNIVGEGNRLSGYSMAAIAGCFLLCAGIILYALLTA